METNINNLIIGIAEKLYNMQNDISFCQAETNIYFIGTIDTVVKFLQWLNNEENFNYEFKKGE